ncbi:MAG: C25 family cysteine peptidase [Ferruginibacter sp.]
MKKLLLAICVLTAFTASAQLNNSWIDYSKTYYKFKLVKDSLTRISYATLQAAGLAAVNADNFQLWRNGKQVRLYTTSQNAPLTSTGYLEFWGEMNDGKPDKELYNVADYQLNERYSLNTDTAAYFLTVNTAGNNLRFAPAPNASPGTATPEPYFMRKVDFYYNQRLNRGEANFVGQALYSSAYDKGEGYTSNEVFPSYDLAQEFRDLNVYTAGPANSVSIRVNVAGNAPNTRNVVVKLFSNVVYDNPMPYFTYSKINLTNQPLSLLQNTNYLPIYVSDVSSLATDRIVVASIGLTYPALFNFNNQKNFNFELPASATSNYLVIDNFNSNGVAPVLLDFTEGKRYVGDIISTPGKVKFVLPASTSTLRSFKLVAQDANYGSVSSLTTRNFVNMSQVANQSNYLMVSDPLLYNDGNGVNYVELFRQYRASTSGGGFNAKIYNISELTDQFAFGIKEHPAAIRDFVRYASQSFSTKPEYIFLVGRGMAYPDYKYYESSPITAKLGIIPTFGWPPSDMLLVSEPGNVLPILPVGRLAAINGTEVGNYYEKVREYELAQQTPSPRIADKAWMKNLIHVAGGKDSLESAQFVDYMNGYKNIAQDTLMGARVETFAKTSTGSVQQASSQRIEDLFQEGLGFIGYFGHSSANVFEFNLSNPELYHNQGKYPFFNVSGCSAGNFYIYDPQRLSGNLTLSEKYVLAANRGSIGFLADSHFGIPPFLNFYNFNFYTLFSKTMYGSSVGNQIKKVLQNLGGANPNIDYYTRIHLEEVNLHGDPAIKINYSAKPDYVIEDQLVRISPSIISVADNNFTVKIKMLNIGKAVNDSIFISVKRKLPNDTIRVLYNQLIKGIRNADSITLTVPINQVTDKGLNQLIIKLDATDRVDELYETNNTLIKDFYIFEDELRPAIPYDFSIVNNQNITYYANTANPLSGNRQYVMEVDTTELFNSPFKKVYNKSGPGGIVEFTPTNLTFIDSTVYYWRVSIIPSGTNPVIWNSHSFVYLPAGGTGFNQSHYYQHLRSNYTNINLDASRKYNFNLIPKSLTIRTGLFPFYDYDKVNVYQDLDFIENYGCKYSSLQFYVFDSSTLAPWKNLNVTPTNGRYGSFKVCERLPVLGRYFFEFPYGDPQYRKAAMDFLDSIPAGMFVSVTNYGWTYNTSFINEWKNDTLALGSGKSLYHKLKNIGFTQIDSFTRNLPFLYFFKKGDPQFNRQVIGPGDTSYIDETIVLPTIVNSGKIESVTYGPALKWNALHWRGFSNDSGPGDVTNMEVYGVKNDGSQTLLANVVAARDTTLSFVNARTYPFLKLRMINQDTAFHTPYQLRYLRVNADFAPEGAVAPNITFSMQDSLIQGQTLNVKIAFKNISQVKFDSLLKVKLIITDRNNIPHVVIVPKRKNLPVGDTLLLSYDIDTRNYPGNNTLLIDFNPDNDQPEQYHYNNVLFKDFYVREDSYNPLLDVTFDGIHILNRDIVASKPHIVIKLTDENKFLALADTSLLKVQVRYPDNTLHNYNFGDTLRFTPANISSGQNVATIDFYPYFPEDGDYELIVSGKDMNGNKAGDLEYHVTFTVINKPMISNLLNYPNPFTTSTAFVFTITGSEVPQNMRIQVLTITGKIVREITMNELGPIHIGRNITSFKWDGTDMYGQKLANGVYLYRVLTNLNGKSLDKYRAEGDRTDKFFNKGYGKMYLMR